MIFTDFFVEASLLEYELDKEIAKLHAAVKQEARFGKHLPTEVAEVAKFIYDQEIEVSIEANSNNIVNGIIKVIKKIFKAIGDLLRRLHAHMIKKQNAHKFAITTIGKLDENDPKIIEAIRIFNRILPKKEFGVYLIALQDIQKDLVSNALLRGHGNSEANKTVTHKALNTFGYGFSDMLDMYRFDANGKRVSSKFETPDAVITDIQAKFNVTSSVGEWKVSDIKHFLSQMESYNQTGVALDYKKVNKHLDDYLKQTNDAITNGNIDPTVAMENMAIASKWLMTVFKIHTLGTQALNNQILAGVKTITNNKSK